MLDLDIDDTGRGEGGSRVPAPIEDRMEEGGHGHGQEAEPDEEIEHTCHPDLLRGRRRSSASVAGHRVPLIATIAPRMVDPEVTVPRCEDDTTGGHLPESPVRQGRPGLNECVKTGH
jgi:hypothetical protein